MARALTVWRPFKDWVPFDFEQMRREMDRFWDSFFERGRRGKVEEEGAWFPTLDLTETKDDLVIKAEIPGIDPKDIDISLSDGILTIKGEKKQEREEKEEAYHLIERSYGAFARSLQLPKGIQSDKIQATYKNGVLRVVLPKSEEAKKREIKIKVD